MEQCPKCKSDKVKKRCCGGRRCLDCKYKWNVKRLAKPVIEQPKEKVDERKLP